MAGSTASYAAWFAATAHLCTVSAAHASLVDTHVMCRVRLECIAFDTDHKPTDCCRKLQCEIWVLCTIQMNRRHWESKEIETNETKGSNTVTLCSSISFNFLFNLKSLRCNPSRCTRCTAVLMYAMAYDREEEKHRLTFALIANTHVHRFLYLASLSASVAWLQQ